MDTNDLNARNTKTVSTIVDSLSGGVLTADISNTLGLPAITIKRADGQPLGHMDSFGDQVPIAGITLGDTNGVSLLSRVTTRNKALAQALRSAIHRISADHLDAADADAVSQAMVFSKFSG